MRDELRDRRGDLWDRARALGNNPTLEWQQLDQGACERCRKDSWLYSPVENQELILCGECVMGLGSLVFLSATIDAAVEPQIRDRTHGTVVQEQRQRQRIRRRLFRENPKLKSPRGSQREISQRAKERTAKALEMRDQGATWEAIGDEMGVNRQRAWAIANRGQERQRRRVTEPFRDVIQQAMEMRKRESG